MMLHVDAPTRSIPTHAVYFDLSRPLPPTRKRSRFSDIHEHSIAEYYRHECLEAFYSAHNDRPAQSDGDVQPRRALKQRACRRVTFNSDPLVLGEADPDVDRRPTPVSRVSSGEMIDLMASRVIPTRNK